MVSIIIPFYNHHKYLAECLDSLYNQTVQDFEIIIVDDCSDVPLKNGDYKLITHDNNRGVACSCNTGLRSAQGEYIKFFDADDIAFPKMLEWNLEAMKQGRWCVGGCQYIDEDGNDIERDIITNRFRDIEFANLQEVALVPGFPNRSCMYEKSLLFEAGLYDERLRSGEDIEIWIRIFKICEPVFITKKIYKYRQGSSRTRGKYLNAESEKLYQELITLRKNEGVSPQRKNIII